MNNENLYNVLGVDETATQEDIKKKFLTKNICINKQSNSIE